MKFINFFLFFWVLFALLDPELGSRNPIESGSNLELDPKHCFLLSRILDHDKKMFFYYAQSNQ
jgi:hypothetical protein